MPTKITRPRADGAGQVRSSACIPHSTTAIGNSVHLEAFEQLARWIAGRFVFVRLPTSAPLTAVWRQRLNSPNVVPRIVASSIPALMFVATAPGSNADGALGAAIGDLRRAPTSA